MRIRHLAMTAVAGLLAGGCLTDEPELGSNQDPYETFEEFKARTPVIPEIAPDAYIVEGDVRIHGDEALYEYWEQRPQAGALVIKNINGVDVKWNATDKLNLTYCIHNSFGTERMAIMKAAMDRATREWEARANVNFIHVTSQDGAGCTNTNNNVRFNIIMHQGSPAASAPGPYWSRANSVMSVSQGTFGNTPAGLRQVLGHELGHILGFQHEHLRPEFGLCEGIGTDIRTLTPYDATSIMNWPGCPQPATKQWWSQRDREGAASVYGAGTRGNADIMWKQTSTNAFAVWGMQGGSVVWSGSRPITAGWDIIGTGDFNADFRGDLLQRHTNGTYAVWLWNGSFGYLNGWDLSGVPAGYTFQGTGDVDGDNRTELIFKSGSTVQFAFLAGDGFVVNKIYPALYASGATVPAPAGRTLLGTADLDRNGQADLVWGSSSDVVIWLMGGLTGTTVTETATLTDTDGTLHVGFGDFDGDGFDDMFRRNPVNGRLEIWFMNGTTLVSTGLPNVSSGGWLPYGVGDFNGDWKADLLWRHSGGTLGMWFMNGATHVADGFPGWVDNDWVVRGTPRFD